MSIIDDGSWTIRISQGAPVTNVMHTFPTYAITADFANDIPISFEVDQDSVNRVFSVMFSTSPSRTTPALSGGAFVSELGATHRFQHNPPSNIRALS